MARARLVRSSLQLLSASAAMTCSNQTCPSRLSDPEAKLWAQITANIPAAAIQLLEAQQLDPHCGTSRGLVAAAISAGMLVLGLKRRHLSAEGLLVDRCVSTELRGKVTRRLAQLRRICQKFAVVD